MQFIQYLLLTPTYINILNVYAFCNTHDITWGTKGDDKAEKLPIANLKPGGKVEVNIPQDDGDLNDQYDAEMKMISVKAPKEVKNISATEKQEDYYKGFRSAVVLVWMFSNLALSAVVLSTAGTGGSYVGVSDPNATARATIYMAVVLWSVAALSFFRFVGAMWFLVVRLVSPSILLSTARAHHSMLGHHGSKDRFADPSTHSSEACDLLISTVLFTTKPCFERPMSFVIPSVHRKGERRWRICYSQ